MLKTRIQRIHTRVGSNCASVQHFVFASFVIYSGKFGVKPDVILLFPQSDIYMLVLESVSSCYFVLIDDFDLRFIWAWHSAPVVAVD